MDKRIIKESHRRSSARLLVRSVPIWFFSIILTWAFFSYDWVSYLSGLGGSIVLNVIIIVVASVYQYGIERLWLRVRWGLKD